MGGATGMRITFFLITSSFYLVNSTIINFIAIDPKNSPDNCQTFAESLLSVLNPNKQRLVIRRLRKVLLENFRGHP